MREQRCGDWFELCFLDVLVLDQWYDIVDYFIGFTKNKNVKIEENEIHQYKWATYEEALSTFQYESRKEVLKKALEYLNYESRK